MLMHWLATTINYYRAFSVIVIMFVLLLVVRVQVMLLIHVHPLLSYRKQGFVVQAMQSDGELGISTWLIMHRGFHHTALVILE